MAALAVGDAQESIPRQTSKASEFEPRGAPEQQQTGASESESSERGSEQAVQSVYDASWTVAEAPSAESPLQHYAGSICEGGHLQYTARMHACHLTPASAVAAAAASEAPLPQVPCAL